MLSVGINISLNYSFTLFSTDILTQSHSTGVNDPSNCALAGQIYPLPAIQKKPAFFTNLKSAFYILNTRQFSLTSFCHYLCLVNSRLLSLVSRNRGPLLSDNFESWRHFQLLKTIGLDTAYGQRLHTNIIKQIQKALYLFINVGHVWFVLLYVLWCQR